MSAVVKHHRDKHIVRSTERQLEDEKKNEVERREMIEKCRPCIGL